MIEMKNHTFESLDKNKLQRMLKIKQLYTDGSLTQHEAKKRMQNEVGSISPEEFAAAEQLLKDEDPDECRKEDVRSMLDLFDGLIPATEVELPYGHPIDAYLRENIKMKELLQQGGELLQKPFIINAWSELMEIIVQYKRHFSRKQNQLYSALERKGFDRPSTTMWVYDDHIRDEMNEAMELLNEKRTERFTETFAALSVDLQDLMSKEELILYPTALKLISSEEFEEMKSGDREIGFFLIDMPEYGKAKEGGVQSSSTGNFMEDLAMLLAKHGVNQTGSGSNAILDVAEGKLTLEQINLLFRHMPVDISFVDENELVAFYTDTPHRVFPRSKGVIGREVRNCHPPKSVHLVEEIIEKFRTGEQSRAEFWINKPDVFIYIVYVAVRDENGKFRGVMEMMQDCTRIRNLEGSRTLLTWENEEHGTERNDSPTNDPDDNSKTELTPGTRLKDLLKSYPKLMDDITQISPRFKMLRSPMAKVVLPVATLKMMSEQSGVPIDMLIEKISKLIDTY
ncbi:MAG: PAS domain-containing protein [Bacteroides sp.]|uniref:PAS domain-containing protein n=1 Tax=Bacteroides sp. TaxID=29523 RepID=UPI002FC70504